MSICIDCGRTGADTRDGHAARCGPCRAAYGRFRAEAYSYAKRGIPRPTGRCVVCGGRGDLTWNHKKPISKGGTTSRDNLEVMCRPCNSRASNGRWAPPTPKKSTE